jgi:hypothetical protein
MPLKHKLANTKFLAGKAARHEAELFSRAVKVCKDEDIGAKACVKRQEFKELGWRRGSSTGRTSLSKEL